MSVLSYLPKNHWQPHPAWHHPWCLHFDRRESPRWSLVVQEEYCGEESDFIVAQWWKARSHARTLDGKFSWEMAHCKSKIVILANFWVTTVALQLVKMPAISKQYRILQVGCPKTQYWISNWRITFGQTVQLAKRDWSIHVSVLRYVDNQPEIYGKWPHKGPASTVTCLYQ